MGGRSRRPAGLSARVVAGVSGGVLALLLALATAGGAQATSTAPTLSIEPQSGPAGSEVTAVARGYQECRPAQESPTSEEPGGADRRAAEPRAGEPAVADTPADAGAVGVVVF